MRLKTANVVVVCVALLVGLAGVICWSVVYMTSEREAQGRRVEACRTIEDPASLTLCIKAAK